MCTVHIVKTNYLLPCEACECCNCSVQGVMTIISKMSHIIRKPAFAYEKQEIFIFPVAI